MRQPKTVKFDERTYTIGQFTPSRGLKVMHKLGRFAAEPLARMFPTGSGDQASKKKSLLDVEISGEGFAACVSTFFERCDEETFVSFVKELLSVVFVGPTSLEDSFDAEFSDEHGYQRMFKLLAEVLKHNFTDFFKGATAAFAKVAPKAPQAKEAVATTQSA